MTMTDASWHVVRNITGVTGIVGPGSEPTPLTDADVAALHVEVAAAFKFKVGDNVKVVSGPFEGYCGVLQEISDDQSKVVVLVNTGRRDMPLEVEAKDIDLAE